MKEKNLGDGTDMEIAVCHYSFRRTWIAENWGCMQLAQAVQSLGVKAVDFHTRLLPSTEKAAAQVTEAIDATGLILSSLSLGNDFNKDDPAEYRDQIKATVRWIRFAASVGAPLCRIFGGNLRERQNRRLREESLQRIIDALSEATGEAEKLGVVLAMENHGGLPCTAEEQVTVIQSVDSPYLRATVDVGNYLQCGQEGHVGTAIAAPYAAYVHFKDEKKVSDASVPWGWKTEPCTVGRGDVEHKRCLEALAKAGYQGILALEYEGPDDEWKGVSESVAFMRGLLADFSVGD